MKDYIIVGFGFAGISIVHLLEKNNKSFVVFNDNPNHVTTTAAALFNPVILKRFTPIWKANEQMELLKVFYTEIQEKLKKQGIPTAVHYPIPLNKQPAVANFNVNLPIGDAIAEKVMSLPMHPYLTLEEQKKVVQGFL